MQELPLDILAASWHWLKPREQIGLSYERVQICVPALRQHLRCDEQLSGRELQCPNCHHLLHIPPVPGKTAQYRRESGKTWATFVSDGRAAPPKGISIDQKKAKPG